MVAVFLLGTGYFFLYNIFLTGEATMEGTFQNMGILLLTLAPVLSMRLFSAEYSAGTDGAADDAAAARPGRSCWASIWARSPSCC